MITCVVDYDPFAMDSRITLIKDEDSSEVLIYLNSLKHYNHLATSMALIKL